jgi:hypothetical protein
MKDIEDIHGIKVFVDVFYMEVRADDLLAPVFASRIADWVPHIQASLWLDSTLNDGWNCFTKLWTNTSRVRLRPTRNTIVDHGKHVP